MPSLEQSLEFQSPGQVSSGQVSGKEVPRASLEAHGAPWGCGTCSLLPAKQGNATKTALQGGLGMGDGVWFALEPSQKLHNSPWGAPQGC